MAIKPPKPEDLAGALQDRPHQEIGRVRIPKIARVKR